MSSSRSDPNAQEESPVYSLVISLPSRATLPPAPIPSRPLRGRLDRGGTAGHGRASGFRLSFVANRRQYPGVQSQPTSGDSRLLVTSTKEPFQPVRLYYSIPDKPFILRVFSGLRCVEPEVGGRNWVWLYQHEVTVLTFSAPYEDVPPELHPVIIGRFKFPEKRRMVLEVRSIQRACEAAKFFGPLLGPKVVDARSRFRSCAPPGAFL
jgi:hypothetical protein